MGRRKIIFVLCIIIILCALLISCSNTNTDDKLNDTEKHAISTENLIDNKTTNSDTDSIYKEYDAYFRFKDKSHYDNTYVNDEILDWTTWNRVGQNIHINSSVDVYNNNKAMVGYTKQDIDAIYIATNEEWSALAIGEEGFNIYVRTDDLNSAMVIENNKINTEDIEISSKIESTYTVTDITEKTMYAKQSVNVRTGPSSDYERVGSLTTNQEVSVTGQADTGWYRINYNDSVAFVSNNYLSDTKVDITTPSNNGGDTNENENNIGGEYIPPTNENIYVPIEPTPTPKPTYTYTVDEVITIVRSTMESNGIMWSVDYASAEDVAEFGPSLGMGWGMDWVPMDDPYTYASSLAEGYLYQGFNLYYTEYLYTENGYVVLKTYFGTQW